jgi:hypothetical protein
VPTSERQTAAQFRQELPRDNDLAIHAGTARRESDWPDRRIWRRLLPAYAWGVENVILTRVLAVKLQAVFLSSDFRRARPGEITDCYSRP